MIIGKSKLQFNDSKDNFDVILDETQDKQQVADFVEWSSLKLARVKLVAKNELEDFAGYLVEDSTGRVHRIGYKQYWELEIDKLALPAIVLPPHSETPSVEKALQILANFAPIAAKFDKTESPYTLPIEVALARNVLGHDIYQYLVNTIKTRI